MRKIKKTKIKSERERKNIEPISVCPLNVSNERKMKNCGWTKIRVVKIKRNDSKKDFNRTCIEHKKKANESNIEWMGKNAMIWVAEEMARLKRKWNWKCERISAFTANDPSSRALPDAFFALVDRTWLPMQRRKYSYWLHSMEMQMKRSSKWFEKKRNWIYHRIRNFQANRIKQNEVIFRDSKHRLLTRHVRLKTHVPRSKNERMKITRIN